jgi:hypothetical protein
MTERERAAYGIGVIIGVIISSLIVIVTVLACGWLK